MSSKTRKLIVELWAEETSISRRPLVIEVPVECSDEDIKRIDGALLDRLATEQESDSEWEFEEYEGDFQVRSDTLVGSTTDLSPDVELTIDELKRLTATACQ